MPAPSRLPRPPSRIWGRCGRRSGGVRRGSASLPMRPTASRPGSSACVVIFSNGWDSRRRSTCPRAQPRSSLFDPGRARSGPASCRARRGGPGALGLGRETGTLEPGKRADLTALALDGPEADLYEFLLHEASAAKVLLTTVDGRPRYEREPLRDDPGS